MAKGQSFESYSLVPLCNGVAFSIFLINVVWNAYRLTQDRLSGDRLMLLLVSIALILLFFGIRIFALTLQDRVILQEMRTRLRAILPPHMAPRINDFSVEQLAALRFASDPELPELCRKVLNDNIQDKKKIKRMIQSGQADHQRV